MQNVNEEVKAEAKAAVKAKGQPTEAKPILKLDSISLVGKVFLEVIDDYRTKKEKLTVVIEVKHPFDEFEEDLRLVIKDPSRRGKFEYLARKEIAKLLELEESKQFLTITGSVQLLPFKDKKTRKISDYAAVEINNIFDDGTLYAVLSDKVIKGGFMMLARERLNLIEKGGEK